MKIRRLNLDGLEQLTAAVERLNARFEASIKLTQIPMKDKNMKDKKETRVSDLSELERWFNEHR
jgi:hypothetical protein